MSPETWIKVLTFSSGLVMIVATFVGTVPTIQDANKVLISAAATAIVGVVDLALYVFFQVKKPISTAFKAGAESVKSSK